MVVYKGTFGLSIYGFIVLFKAEVVSWIVADLVRFDSFETQFIDILACIGH
jgi:hypothetical protein